MREFRYPVELLPADEGGFIVRFPDIPEAITQGDNEPSALEDAIDALEEAIAGRIRRENDIPQPSKGKRGQHTVWLPTLMAAKASLYLALKESGMSKVALAKKLECDEKEVRRLLDPRHGSKIERIEEALGILGKRLEVHLI